MDSSETELDRLIQEIRQAITTDPSISKDVRSLQQAHGKERGVDPAWDEILAKLDEYFLS